MNGMKSMGVREHKKQGDKNWREHGMMVW